MIRRALAHVSLVVREYDEAIAFYVGVLGCWWRRGGKPHGTVAVFQDRYGNLWDLLQPKPADPAGNPAYQYP